MNPACSLAPALLVRLVGRFMALVICSFYWDFRGRFYGKKKNINQKSSWEFLNEGMILQ
jgi:hypothetical protein